MEHKLGKGFTGRHHTEESKEKIRAKKIGVRMSVDARKKMCISQQKRWTPEERKKQSDRLSGIKRNETFKEHLSKIREGRQNPMFGVTGPSSPRWQGGKSFEPYCAMFNESIKERIRNDYNHSCAACQKSEILNGEKLSVHHLDGDKMQGCAGKKWMLVALCRACHNSLHNSERLGLEIMLQLQGCG